MAVPGERREAEFSEWSNQFTVGAEPVHALAAAAGGWGLVSQPGQGERDYQVTVDGDLAGWRRKLQGKRNVTLRTYPGLNHLFVSGTGAPCPAE
jgi:hypothetical protein